EDFATYYCQQY
nr:immunoglobulin light chain junction region [Homo sapiens]